MILRIAWFYFFLSAVPILTSDWFTADPNSPLWPLNAALSLIFLSSFVVVTVGEFVRFVASR